MKATASMLLKRPERDLEEPEFLKKPELPETMQPPIEAKADPEVPVASRPIPLIPAAKADPEASEKFGELKVDLSKTRVRDPKGLISTTVPSALHDRLTRREEGLSGFIAEAVRRHLRADLSQVVEAGYELAKLRAASEEGSQSITARIEMTHVHDVEDAVKYVTHQVQKVSAAFLVGGCVYLKAKKEGLV